MGCKVYSDVSIQTSPSRILDEASQRDAAKPPCSSPGDPDISSHCSFTPKIDGKIPTLDLSMSDKPRLPSSLPSQYDFRLQNRIASLPGRFSDEEHLESLPQSIIQSGNKSHPRVVSLPESMNIQSRATDQPEAYHYIQDSSSDQYVDRNVNTYTDTVCHSVGGSSNTTLIHTLSSEQHDLPSSPSSSCDSVEFTLDDPVQLSDTFLRNSFPPPCFQSIVHSNEDNELLEGDGWLTWSNSPPRPIPALHGPSSLPYARCPSGAEGTIIEEPSSLPRMIWGLDPNDVVFSSHVNRPHSPHPSRRIDAQLSSDGKMQQRSDMSITAIHDACKHHSHVSPRLQSSNFDSLLAGESRDWTGSSLTAFVEKPKTNKLSQGGGLGSDQVNSSQVLDEVRCLRGREYHSDIAVHIPPQTPTTNGPNWDFKTLAAGALSMESSLQSWSNIHRGSTDCGSQSNLTRPERFCARKLIELPSYPLQQLDRFNDLIPRDMQWKYRTSPAVESALNYLPTPPSSSSPRWSSEFSPIQRFSLVAQDASQSEKRHLIDTVSNGLSDDWCHLVWDTFTPVSTPLKINVPRIGNFSLEKTVSTVYETPKFPSPAMSSVHVPNQSAPQHIASSKHTLSPLDAFSMPNSPTVLHARSTLSNPRSIPLSRLRQKCEASKLAPVPEEAISHSYDVLPQSPLGTWSSPDPMLQAQSIHEMLPFGENGEFRQPRVKLPSKVIATKRNNYDVNPTLIRSVSPCDSPAHNAPQKQKKTMALTQHSQIGLPPVAEHIDSFKLMNTSAISSNFRKVTNAV